MRVTREEMHRRAQKAEGRLESGLFTLRSWRKILKDDRYWFLRTVLTDIEKHLNK